MKLMAVCLFLFCSPTLSFAQTNLRSDAVRAVGMGGNAVTGSVLLNPACLGLSLSQCVALNYFNKYALTELSSASVLYACPASPLPFAVNVSTFGYTRYRETMFRLSLSKAVSSGIILGVSTQYAMLQTELYPDAAMRLSTDVGILFISGDNWLAGLSIADLPSVRLDDRSVHVEDFNSFSIQGGFNQQLINNLLIAVSASYRNPACFRLEGGVEYVAYEAFFFRVGLRTNPLKPAFGAGLALSGIRLDAAADYHPLLGVCSGVGLSYSF